MCLNAVNSSVCVYTCCSILTCVIPVFGKDVYIHFIVFIDVFGMYVDLYLLSFRHFNAGPMALPIDDMWQCHPYVGQYMKVATELIPYTKLYL